ncbi:hypothetical protein ACFQ5D_23855 [Paenibacillus farraposensis]|uniref:Uncharacterized protein n=1 Tax=Paenibacillus farraposensis TaxID=2807095 RepID=A0ABW4DHX2_9BACL|nr:hypothetical protein [Paenibacillus farraposensis]
MDGKTIQITTNSSTSSSASSDVNVVPGSTSVDDSNNKFEQKLVDRKKELEQTIATTQKGIEDQLVNLQIAQKSREKVSDERFLSIGDQKIQGYKDQITQLESIIEKSKKRLKRLIKLFPANKKIRKGDLS